MNREVVDTILHLDRLRTGDGQSQRSALEDLQEEWNPFLLAQLRKWGARSDDTQDVLQTVWLKIWKVRARLAFAELAPWKDYLKKSCFSAWLDFKGTWVTTNIEPEDLEELHSSEVDLVATLVVSCAESDAIKSASEELWLSAPDRRLRTRQLLAAELFFSDGVSVELIVKIMQRRSAGTLSRQEVDEWLGSTWAVLGWTHSQVFFSNLRLIADILGLEEGQVSADCNDPIMIQAAERVGVGTDCLQYLIYKCLMPKQFAAEIRNWESHSHYRQTIHSLHSFTKVMYAAASRTQLVRGSNEMLMQHGLWRKLMFDYRYIEDLPIADVLERVQPVADAAGYKSITEPNVTALTSGGRLIRELVKHLEASNG